MRVNSCYLEIMRTFSIVKTSGMCSDVQRRTLDTGGMEEDGDEDNLVLAGVNSPRHKKTSFAGHIEAPSM